MDIIRLATSEDRSALIEICLLTGNSGQDANGLFNEKQMLGNYYVCPYLENDPDCAFVLSQTGQVTGYALATLNTNAFNKYLDEEYLPRVREQYLPRIAAFTATEKDLWGLYTAKRSSDPEFLKAYPSELHIDLLPEAQGHGFGRALMERLLGALKAGGSPGVHLILDAENQRAFGFYQRLNFQELGRDIESITMGISLTDLQ